jgi:ABC-type bacteriocin/lantibiotic exporter with double-glycine peptidase domain
VRLSVSDACRFPPMKRLLILCLLLALASCATGGAEPLSEAVIIEGIPFFSQEAHQCGPTALATVLGYWHRRVGAGRLLTPEQIAAAIYSPTARGVLGIDLELFGREQGFEARQYSGSIADLRQNVDASVPVIILVDYGISIYESNHFMVVTGYAKDRVIVNSGRHEREEVSQRELEKIWKRTHYWALVLRPSPLRSPS